jgi:hypothetical protein
MVPPLAVLALAATATVSREAATWFGVRGPICPLGHLLGEHVCPGCGLTRATSLVVQGRWHDALAINPAGFAVALLCVAAVLLQLDVLRRGAVPDAHLRLRTWGRWCFVGAVLSAWAVRAAGWLPPA